MPNFRVQRDGKADLMFNREVVAVFDYGQLAKWLYEAVGVDGVRRSD